MNRPYVRRPGHDTLLGTAPAVAVALAGSLPAPTAGQLGSLAR